MTLDNYTNKKKKIVNVVFEKIAKNEKSFM